MRLGDYWARDESGRKRMSLRELLVLVDMLPPGSRVKRAFSEAPMLSIADMVTVQTSVLNAIQFQTYAFVASNTPRNAARKPIPPEPVELPEGPELSQPVKDFISKAKGRQKFATAKELHSFFGGMKGR